MMYEASHHCTDQVIDMINGNLGHIVYLRKLSSINRISVACVKHNCKVHFFNLSRLSPPKIFLEFFNATRYWIANSKVLDFPYLLLHSLLRENMYIEILL